MIVSYALPLPPFWALLQCLIERPRKSSCLAPYLDLGYGSGLIPYWRHQLRPPRNAWFMSSIGSPNKPLSPHRRLLMRLTLPPPSPLLNNSPPNRSLSPPQALFLAHPAPTLSPSPPLFSLPCSTSGAALLKNCRTPVFISSTKRLATIERKLDHSQPVGQGMEHASLMPHQIPTFGCLILTSGLQLCVA